MGLVIDRFDVNDSIRDQGKLAPDALRDRVADLVRLCQRETAVNMNRHIEHHMLPCLSCAQGMVAVEAFVVFKDSLDRI